MARALFIGRFQPFHNGHLAVARNILKDFDEVIIGIGSSQEKNTLKNPFSFAERKNMISNTLKKNKIKNFKIFPIPDLYDDIKWVNYIIKNLPEFSAAYSGNEWTIRCLSRHKIKYKKIKLLRGVSSTKIRKLMAQKKNWENLVPTEIAGYINKINGAERIRKIYFR